jgi:hypothetical protein
MVIIKALEKAGGFGRTTYSISLTTAQILRSKLMADILDRTYLWICPKCSKRYEETDISVLQARAITHKCPPSQTPFAYKLKEPSNG